MRLRSALYSFEAPLAEPGQTRVWKSRKLQLPFELSPQPLGRMQAFREDDVRVRRSRFDLRLFDGFAEAQSWARGEQEAREEIRQHIRLPRLRPAVQSAFDEAFAFAEQRLQGRRLRTDASTEEKELQTVSPAEALPIDLASDRLREELAPPKEEAEKLVFEDLWAGLRMSEIVRKRGLPEKFVAGVRRDTITRAMVVLQEIIPNS